MNGNIDTEHLREGRTKRDTYRVRGNALVKKAIEIENLTGCLVKMKVQPAWKHGKVYEHISEGFENPDFNRTNVTASTSYADDSLHVKPVKKTRKRHGGTSTTSKYDPNICQIYRLRHESEADIETDSSWINCRSKGCKWWVHSRCLSIYYENSDNRERRLEKWAESHYYCRQHLPTVAAIGWDRDKNEEVVIKTKKLLKAAIKKK